MWPCQWVRGRELGGLPRESCAVCQQRALGFNGNLRVRDKGFGATVWFGGGWSSGERWRGSEEVLLWVIKLCLLMLFNGCMLWKIQSFSYIKVTTILLFPWLKKFRWQVKGDVYLKEYLFISVMTRSWVSALALFLAYNGFKLDPVSWGWQTAEVESLTKREEGPLLWNTNAKLWKMKLFSPFSLFHSFCLEAEWMAEAAAAILDHKNKSWEHRKSHRLTFPAYWVKY